MIESNVEFYNESIYHYSDFSCSNSKFTGEGVFKREFLDPTRFSIEQ